MYHRYLVSIFFFLIFLGRRVGGEISHGLLAATVPMLYNRKAFLTQISEDCDDLVGFLLIDFLTYCELVW